MDTVTILKTMRAVVADVEAERFNMGQWFNKSTKCGCIVGLTFTSQKLLADEVGIFMRGRRNTTPRTRSGRDLWMDSCDTFGEIGALIGIERDEAEHLFSVSSYRFPVASWGKDGKAEALRRLDKMIAKYTPSGTDERATPRPMVQTA